MIEIFFSYAHEDEELMNQVRRQLIVFERNRRIVKWYDRCIPPGTEWRKQIDRRLDSARIILLFLSPHFIESRYCYEVEGQAALRRHEMGEARVVPIILRPCSWQDSPYGAIQALPPDGKPVSQWKDRDQACLDVARGVMAVVEELVASGSRRHFEASQHQATLAAPNTNADGVPSGNTEGVLAAQFLTFIEGRRVMFEPLADRCPGGVVESLAVIRKRIQTNMEGLDRRSQLFRAFDAMRTEVQGFLSVACRQCPRTETCEDCRIQRMGCAEHLKEFRARFGSHIAAMCAAYGLEPGPEIATIVRRWPSKRVDSTAGETDADVG